MAKRYEIPIERLREVLAYNEQTGNFTWIKRLNNRGMPGSKAGCPSGKGYWIIRFDGKIYMAHRLAWAYVHGDCPEHLDHINGDGTDNRIANLRPCTQATNNQNMRVRRNKKSPHKGVSLWRQGRYSKWRARIVVDKVEISLGYFDTEEEAHAAYCAAAEKHFGQFARSH